MRYLLFLYDNYYPSGGWTDFEGAFSDIEQARAKADNEKYKMDCAEIVDIQTMKVVLEGFGTEGFAPREYKWSTPDPELQPIQPVPPR